MARQSGHSSIWVPPGRPRRGFTLIELTVSLAILSILLVGIGSSIVLASHALPNNDSPLIKSVEAGTALDQIVNELETALSIAERSQTSLTFTVPDRDGNGISERIRYAWTGIAGDPLIRQYNSRPEVPFLADVNLFNLVYDIQSTTESYPGAGVEDAFDSLMVDYTDTSGLKAFAVTASDWIGQYFAPDLPGIAMSWRPTRIKFKAKQASSPGSAKVQIRPADANLQPTDTVLEQFPLNQLQLDPAAFTWHEYSFGAEGWRMPEEGICLVLEHNSGISSVTIQYDDDSGSGRLRTLDGGASWTYDSGRSMICQLYGKITRPGPSQYATSGFLKLVRVTLQAGSPDAPRTQTSIQTLNAPALLSARWETDFDTDPTAMDVDADGVPDWRTIDGSVFDTTELGGGTWKVGTTTKLRTYPDNDFVELTVANIRFRDTIADGASGAVFDIYFDRVDTTSARISASIVLEDDGTQTLKAAHYLNATTAETFVRVKGLPREFVDLRLILDPENDTVAVFVNGVYKATHLYWKYTGASNTARYAQIGESGADAEFDSVCILVVASTL
ncbi:MAG: prepilin-type N-terminal cleavage/methylation domain-containing protein [Planctomycetes bacterium]|nr:prepilin-type N-terminal cleavage/methylation domain-containing protein [Planctomycetota bacterium]